MRRQPTRQTTPKTPRHGFRSTDRAPVERVDITTPLPDWTVPQLTNLLRTLYGRQYLLNRMMQGETLYIEEPFDDRTYGQPARECDRF